MIFLELLLMKYCMIKNKIKNKKFKVTNNPQRHGYEKVLASTIYNLFDLNPGNTIKNKVAINQELTDELHKLITAK